MFEWVSCTWQYVFVGCSNSSVDSIENYYVRNILIFGASLEFLRGNGKHVP